jgi:hypothetical protein
VITHRCVEALHKTFITPLDRDAIYQLISHMDDVMDYVESARWRDRCTSSREMTRRAGDSPTCSCAPRVGRVAVAGLSNLKRPDDILKRASK